MNLGDERGDADRLGVLQRRLLGEVEAGPLAERLVESRVPVRDVVGLDELLDDEAYSGQHYRSCDTHLELQRSAVDQDR
jgi:hypothetical protein